MKKIYVLLMTLCLFALQAVAQTRVTGTILDENGDGAIGASIMAEGTTTGTATDFDGKFELQVPAGVKHLIISYAGYKTENVPVKPIIKLTLQPDVVAIEEVVVTGMVKQDKRLFTGAATKVNAEDAKMDGMADISRSLEGRAAGVTVQNVSGTFGTAPKIRVRGATSIYGSSKPLWVVDGVVLEENVELGADDLSSGDPATLISSAISGLNADDIESFQILKDGSATSIYGARAMAGVIVVTTKKGRAGQSKLSYTGEFTYRMKPSYNDYNICNSQEQMGINREMADKGWLEMSTLNTAKNSGIYGRMYKLIDTYDPATNSFLLLNTDEAKTGYLRQAEMRNTDWFDQLFNHNVMMNHSVSFSTGTERAQVYSSLSAMYDPGWYMRSSVQRYTGNVNANFNILKNLSFKINTNGTYIKQEAPGTTNQSTDVVSGAVSRDFDISPFSYAMNTSRALDAKEKYRRNYCDFNILDELERNYHDIKRTDIKFQGELSYKPVKGLEVSVLGAVRYSNSRIEQNILDDSNQARAYRAGLGLDPGDVENDLIRDANNYLYTDPDVKGALPESVLPKGGIYDLRTDQLLSYDFRGTISFNRGFYNDGSEGDTHIISLFAGAELNSTDRESGKFRGWGYQFNNGGIPFTYYKLFKQSQEENTDYYSRSFAYTRNLAFFGMATYSYKERYTINGTVRYEGTNKLGKSRQARWLPTWNVSGRWNAENEDFFRNTFGDAWTTANLKFSASLTADRGPYFVTNALPVFMASSPWRPLSSVSEAAIALQQLQNADLTYEKKLEYNVGVALGFLKNRINIEFDWYYRNNYDLIGEKQTAGIGGEIYRWANYADMIGTGEELSISTINIDRKNFKWTTDFVFWHGTTKITNLDANSSIGDKVSNYGAPEEGYPFRGLWSFQFAGLTDNGMPTFYANKERTEIWGPDNYSEINFQDMENTDMLKYEGSIDPTFSGSFNNTFTIFQNLKIGVFFSYSFGNVIRLNNLCGVYAYNYSDMNSSLKEMKNRWMAPGDENVTNIPGIPSKRQYDNTSGIRYAYSAYNASDQRVAKGDFIRLKEITLEYSFPKKWFESQKAVSSFSTKLSVNNIALLYADKKLNGQDPEYAYSGGVSSPLPRQFTLTFRLGF